MAKHKKSTPPLNDKSRRLYRNLLYVSLGAGIFAFAVTLASSGSDQGKKESKQ